jgi:hypothetical protein
MLTRLLDERTGAPRHPAFWLVLAALASSLFLAFYALCHQQVLKAESQRTQAAVQRLAAGACDEPVGSVAALSCSVTHARVARAGSAAVQAAGSGTR